MSIHNDNNNNNPVGVGVGVALALGAAALYTYRLRSTPLPPSRDLEGIAVCLTGGNIGIGRAVAWKLGQRGAQIFMGCRNVEQGQQVCDQMGNGQVVSLDLADPASVASFSKSIQTHCASSGLHLLINNAGAMIEDRNKLTNDHYDRSMAVNHLGWVQLTQNLLPLLEKTKSDNRPHQQKVRIVNVGSKLEKTAQFPANLQDSAAWDHWMKTPPTPYNAFQAYAQAKLALTAVTLGWNSHNSNIPILLVSPGMVHTNLPRFMPLWQRVLTWPFRAMLLRTPEQAADTVLFAATNPQAAQSGTYYNADGQEIQQNPNQCSDAARNPEIRQQIWEATQRALEKREN